MVEEWKDLKNFENKFKISSKGIVTNEDTNRKAATRAKKVIQYDTNKNKIAEYDCVVEAAKKTNTDKTRIGKCCNKRQKTAGGYIWKFTPLASRGNNACGDTVCGASENA